ncbi:MAG TPA: nucleotidyltransferase family protein [Rhizomicrobium sp.]
MRRADAIAKLRQLKPLLDRHGVERLRVFGSVARDEAGDASDIDLIVDYINKPDLLKFIGLQHALADALGIEVDLTTLDGLRPELRDEILAEAIDAEAA